MSRESGFRLKEREREGRERQSEEKIVSFHSEFIRDQREREREKGNQMEKE